LVATRDFALQLALARLSSAMDYGKDMAKASKGSKMGQTLAHKWLFFILNERRNCEVAWVTFLGSDD
jgi:hypothetical protein